MTLIKRNRVWHYQAKIHGRTFRRSTGETDRRRAEAAAKKIEAEVRLRKKQPSDWLRLSLAMNREVARIETDVSRSQADRALYAFAAFLIWLGRDPEISEITYDLLEDFQRHRLRTAALATMHKDLNFMIRLLRENEIHLSRPTSKAGRETEVRAFTRDELCFAFQSRYRALPPLVCDALGDRRPTSRAHSIPAFFAQALAQDRD